MTRYKVILNKTIEYHLDAVNDHTVIADALSQARMNGYMDMIESITVSVIG